MTSKEFFDSMPEEMKSCARKVFMYYGKYYPENLHRMFLRLPLYDVIENTYNRVGVDNWFKFWWGFNNQPYKIATDTYTFTDEFIEWFSETDFE